ncbi:MAG: hypothetical protein LBR37_02050 [Erysipelotrichaceae bacterium]|jgi:hypothetical protein|nr:hypothetical protein [Erysipelotrichaceae bacterium]
MANLDIAVRFTDDLYATKAEVKQELRLISVDSLWPNILAYRAFFNRELEIFNHRGASFSLNLNPGFLGRLSELDLKILKLTLLGESHQTTLYELVLKEVARYHQQVISSDFAVKVKTNQVTAINREQIPIINYGFALNDLLSEVKPLSEETIKLVAAKFLLDDPKTLQYRLHELETQTLNNLEAATVPAHLIRDVITKTLDFVSQEKLPFSLRIMVLQFIILYTKPFTYNSEELSLLLMKLGAASLLGTPLGALLPFEGLLFELEDLKPAFEATMINSDLTYYLDAVTKILLSACDQATNALAAFPTLVSENPAPLMENQPEESVPTVKETAVPKEGQTVSYLVDVALPRIPIGYSKMEAENLVLHLLEIEPKMKKMEAKFYAHHCTKGKYYTISQFKHYNNCVYETARTSMDHLVEMGYYSKQQIKNKFVYTPINKRKEGVV